MITPASVRRQSIEIMTTRVLIREMMLEIRLINVPVTARCAPFTSLFRRDIISPVLVLVKKRMLMRCMWAYNAWRRSLMMPSPTAELR